jgi:GTP cyclohydrolase I
MNDKDLDRIEALARELLILLGEDPEREGLRQTPYRLAELYQDLSSGYRTSPEEVVADAIFTVEYDHLILVRDIEYFSLCEHHLLPFFGKVHVGYIPSGKVIGLSKIPRIVDVFAKRLQLQERMTEEIAQFLERAIQPQGVAVVAEGMHLCLAMRGAKKGSARLVTSAVKGLFRKDARSRAEIMNLIGMGSSLAER